MTWSFWQHLMYQHQYDQLCSKMTTWDSTFDLPYISKKLMARIEGYPWTHLKNIHLVFTFYALGFLLYTHTHLLCPTKDFDIVSVDLPTSIAQRNFSILPLVESIKQPTKVNFNFWHTPWQPYSWKFLEHKLHITSMIWTKNCV
jgi:hypothetical protein